MSDELVVRFYGRFLFVSALEELTVLAVNMSRESDVNADRHDAILTIAERSIDPDETDRGDLEPTFRFMAGDEPLDGDAGQRVWNITGSEVIISGDSGFAWDHRTQITVADLGTISSGELDKKQYVDSFPNLGTTAIIRMRSGQGVPRQMTSDPLVYDYVNFYDSADSPPATEGGPFAFADMVEVTVALPDSGLGVSLDRAKRKSKIKVVHKKGLPARISSKHILNFSNLCTGSHRSPDTEFAAFYALLKKPPPLNMRRIPRVKPYPSARPFGDCYLGAMISS